LLLAYVAGSASNIGAFYYFANVMLRNATGHGLSVLAAWQRLSRLPPVWIAWRDVKISARVMLVMEAVSVALLSIVLVLVLFHHGLHGDPNQLHFRGVTASGFRQGLVLALYSFVGFEAATALGSEARNPLKAIPRAVILTAVWAASFFHHLRLHGSSRAGHERKRPRNDRRAHARARGRVGGVPVLGLLIDFGALVSLFAGILAGITAAARVLLMMSHNGLTHGSLRATHARNETPTGATVATGLAAFLPVAFLAVKGRERARRLWLAGHARSLWIRGQLWAGVLRPSGLSARSPRRGQPRDEDHPMDRMSRHGICSRRESLSGARRRVW
jgi:amino acid transporter